MLENEIPPAVRCPVCNHSSEGDAQPENFGKVAGNTQRFRETVFRLWRCPRCLSIVAVDPVNYEDIYRDYPLNNRKVDVFARNTLRNLLRRLVDAGMKKHHVILDYGCGNGIFVRYLQDNGFTSSTGYDPYHPKYAVPPSLGKFDVVIANDTLEHCDDVVGMIRHCLALTRPQGLLYLGTADATPVDMRKLESDLTRLHQPFHRVILTEQTFHAIVRRFDVDILKSYRRSYHDTLMPFANYRFLDELLKATRNNLDVAFDENATKELFLKTPSLWFFALFGYFFPSAIEPAIVVRKRASG